jgi:ribosomal protein S27E
VSDVKCPYCEHRQSVCHDDGFGYSEDEAHQLECRNCDKTFVFYTSIHFSYEAYQADCLNGSPHNYERTKTYPPHFARMRCEDCGHERALTYDEKNAPIDQPHHTQGEGNGT